MKPKILASIGAVLLYLYCEFFQASPLAFLEQARVTTVARSSPTVADELQNESTALFAPVKLVPVLPGDD